MSVPTSERGRASIEPCLSLYKVLPFVEAFPRGGNTDKTGCGNGNAGLCALFGCIYFTLSKVMIPRPMPLSGRLAKGGPHREHLKTVSLKF